MTYAIIVQGEELHRPLSMGMIVEASILMPTMYASIHTRVVNLYNDHEMSFYSGNLYKMPPPHVLNIQHFISLYLSFVLLAEIIITYGSLNLIASSAKVWMHNISLSLLSSISM